MRPPTADTRAPGVNADADAAQLLRALLEEGHYAEISTLLRDNALKRPFAEPFSGHRIRSAIGDLPALPQLLVRLLSLGAAVDLGEAERTLDASAVDRLVDAGLLERDGGRLRSRFVVVCHLNRFFVVSPPLWLRGYEEREALVAIAPDSYWMAQFVANRGPLGRVLDLCTGSGLLATLPDAAQVVAVELDPVTASVARFNVLLNGLGERIDVRDGDLYEPVAGEQPFDLIVANPPIVPSPEGISVPLAGDGGPDGDAALRRVLAGVERHLAPGGRALVHGQGFGGEAEPALADWLREQLADSTLGATLFLSDRQSLESAGVTLRELWQLSGAPEADAYAAWERFCAPEQLTSHHTFLLQLTQGGGGTLAVHRLLGS
ncbi:methyltransferase [Conexibacter woesei]|uniref:Methyltransferase small n=1 Tax=Conexibacter woesei (strain DSM 14684 / CCUG 47730 / CIP 108061 / JCM 11494 / NBRC 100937 / ID131577) TaxID=469383 RepID=D3FCD1_CONWI|nr:methyltransferase [Conexibacter woesei]ADB53426.1 methyltransferase small [Conexibacter woesei DSM 14684]